MSEHTPEPWKRATDIYADRGCIDDSNDVRIATTSMMARIASKEEIAANARRIVACVNACAGLDLESLEKMPLGALAILRDAAVMEAVRQFAAKGASSEADLAAVAQSLLDEWDHCIEDVAEPWPMEMDGRQLLKFRRFLAAMTKLRGAVIAVLARQAEASDPFPDPQEEADDRDVELCGCPIGETDACSHV